MTLSTILRSLPEYQQYRQDRHVANIRRAEWRANMAPNSVASNSAHLRYLIALKMRDASRELLIEALRESAETSEVR